jgi:hypothetical protein
MLLASVLLLDQTYIHSGDSSLVACCMHVRIIRRISYVLYRERELIFLIYEAQLYQHDL